MAYANAIAKRNTGAKPITKLDLRGKPDKRLSRLDESTEYTDNFDTIEVLDCRLNNLLELGPLPPRLRELKCGSNRLLTKITGLPNTLEKLSCAGITHLIEISLPENLQEFDCFSCELVALPELPLALSSEFK